MSELRQDLITGNWSIIAPERGKKPRRSKKKGAGADEERPKHERKCPFCPGNEDRYEVVLVNQVTDDDGDWRVRIVENKYKIFDAFDSCPAQPEPFRDHGIYSYYQACGDHFLVIETNRHDRCLGQLSQDEIYLVFGQYVAACHLLEKNPNNFIAIMFKNQGPGSGASQPHAHSQILGSRIVPAWIRNAFHTQERYFDEEGTCVMCHILRYELAENERVVYANDHFIVLSPYAASAPYEMWVVPRRHYACFHQITDVELHALADAMQYVLSSYISKIDNPDFNYFIHSSPYRMAEAPFYHSFIQIMTRTQTLGGFEMGTRMPVNPVAPEAAAALFKKT